MIHPSSIQQLRDQLSRMAGPGRRVTASAVPVGVVEIDSQIPGCGLLRGGIHDVVGDLPAITGFLAALLGRQKAIARLPIARILWVTPYADLFAPGLSQFGLDHKRLIVARARRDDDRLWTAEEALREPGIGAVVAEVEDADLTETKRLQLAAEASGGIGFLIRRRRQTSAALTRWLIEPARSMDCRAAWQVTLERCRGAEAGGSWILRWDDASLSFRLVAALGHRPAESAAA
jgi:protein ImuA